MVSAVYGSLTGRGSDYAAIAARLYSDNLPGFLPPPKLTDTTTPKTLEEAVERVKMATSPLALGEALRAFDALRAKSADTLEQKRGSEVDAALAAMNAALPAGSQPIRVTGVVAMGEVAPDAKGGVTIATAPRMKGAVDTGDINITFTPGMANAIQLTRHDLSNGYALYSYVSDAGTAGVHTGHHSIDAKAGLSFDYGPQLYSAPSFERRINATPEMQVIRAEGWAQYNAHQDKLWAKVHAITDRDFAIINIPNMVAGGIFAGAVAIPAAVESGATWLSANTALGATSSKFVVGGALGLSINETSSWMIRGRAPSAGERLASLAVGATLGAGLIGVKFAGPILTGSVNGGLGGGASSILGSGLIDHNQ